MASKTIAQSSTLRQIGPTLSIDQLNVIAPVRLTRPKVERNPATRLTVQGDQIEPKVSVPMPKATSPAEVAEAGPAEDPLLPWLGFQGLRVWPPNHTSSTANSPVESLATRTAPACS